MYNILDGILRVTFEDNNNNSVQVNIYLAEQIQLKTLTKADWRKAEKKEKNQEK